MISLQLADKQGLLWAQSQVIAHHYLHKPVDVRCLPIAYLVMLLGEVVGCLIFGRPESTRCNGWYGSVEDLSRKKIDPRYCRITRWQVLNLARVWLDPRVQRADVEGTFIEPQNLIGPRILPGFYDRKDVWRPAFASYVINLALERVGYDYLVRRPPVWMEEPYEIREVLSYCDTRIHHGTLYRSANFTLIRKNDRGIETYARPIRRLTHVEKAHIHDCSQHNRRAQKLRRERAVTQLSLMEVAV